jgi:uncharacterized protein YndB with AHSA1/START domain
VVVRREVTLPAAPDEVWRVVSDPARLPAWWPGVARVEEVTGDAWTKVFTSPKGKSVRADYTLVEVEPEERVTWRQEVEESPFERILASARTEIALGSEGAGTRVTIELEQRPRGWARFAPVQFRAAGVRQVQGALDGLEELFGSGDAS